MVFISSEIDINRSPTQVRDVLLNFPDWPEWLTTGLTITSLDKTKEGPKLKPGDRLRSNFRGTALKPKVLENQPKTFQWRGRFGGILLVGHRRFFFERSKRIPGGTRLVQNEDIKGLLSFMFKENAKQGKIAREAMDQFAVQLKQRAEAL